MAIEAATHEGRVNFLDVVLPEIFMVQDKRVCHLKIINQNNKPNKEKTMKKMTVVLGVIGFAFVSLAGELTVTGTGVVKRQSDKMKITFTVSAEDKDMTVARRMFEEHTATLASAFVAAGISTNEVVTSGVSMCVDYDWHEGRKFNGSSAVRRSNR